MELGQINEIDSQIQNLNDPLGYKKKWKKKKRNKKFNFQASITQKTKNRNRKKKKEKKFKKNQKIQDIFSLLFLRFLINQTKGIKNIYILQT